MSTYARVSYIFSKFSKFYLDKFAGTNNEITVCHLLLHLDTTINFGPYKAIWYALSLWHKKAIKNGNSFLHSMHIFFLRTKHSWVTCFHYTYCFGYLYILNMTIPFIFQETHDVWIQVWPSIVKRKAKSVIILSSGATLESISLINSISLCL